MRAWLYEHTHLLENWFVGDAGRRHVWIVPAKYNGWRERALLTDHCDGFFDRLRMVPPTFAEGLGVSLALAPFHTYGVPLADNPDRLIYCDGAVLIWDKTEVDRCLKKYPHVHFSDRSFPAFLILRREWGEDEIDAAAFHSRQFAHEVLAELPADGGWWLNSVAIELWQRGLVAQR